MNIREYISNMETCLRMRQPRKILEMLTDSQHPCVDGDETCQSIHSLEQLQMIPYLDHLELITDFNFNFLKNEDIKLVQMKFKLSQWKTPPPLKLNCASREELRGNFELLLLLFL